jgi:hypothetical protein
MMKMEGMKMPRLETKASLSGYMMDHSIDSSITYCAIDTVAFEKLTAYLNDYAAILVFNKDGYMNIYADKRYCSAPVENYAGKLCTASILKIDSTKTEHDLVAFLKPFASVIANRVDTNTNYSVYLTWSKWYNKKNNDVYRWYSLLQQQHNCNIKLHFINTDVRAEYYGLQKRKKIRASLHSEQRP